MADQTNNTGRDDQGQPPDAVTMGGDRTPRRLSREEIANIEIGHTDVTPSQARWLVIVFLAIACIIPLVQVGWDLANGRKPAIANLVDIRPKPLREDQQPGFSNNFGVLPTAGQLEKFERNLEERSVTRHVLLGPAQYVLTGWLRVGNEEAFVGSDGYLFYRPGVQYLTDTPFLDASRQQAMAKLHHFDPRAPQPDPIKAIVQFKEQLAKRGIVLVIVPTTVKPMLHPDKLSSRYDEEAGPLQSPSFEPFVAAMKQAGVHVFDPTPMLDTRQREKGDAFLKTDTHWTPEGMNAVARALADYLAQQKLLPEREAADYQREAIEISNHGDIVTMLKLPEWQGLYPKETVTTQRITDAQGKPWRAHVDGDVLLLGDSFTNIYSLDGMKWGTHAGFAETLSYHLQRPIDRLSRNDAGAYSTREMLAQELRIHYAKYEKTGKASGREILADKKVVVWQFAMRELFAGDWKLIELYEANPEAFGEVPKRDDQPTAPDGLVIEGKIAQLTRPPRPGSVPYKDSVIAIHLTGVKATGGDVEGSEVVIRTFGMRDNKHTDAAGWQTGQTIRLKVTPWQTAKEAYGTYMFEPLDDLELELLPTYWGETATR